MISTPVAVCVSRPPAKLRECVTLTYQRTLFLPKHNEWKVVLRRSTRVFQILPLLFYTSYWPCVRLSVVGKITALQIS
jgi:hypothetical protein